MATRFYFGTTNYTSNSPGFDAGWEQTGGAFRKQLVRKSRLSLAQTILNFSQSVPITTTQDILNVQFVSDPIPAQLIIGTFSLSVTCDQNATTENATLAVVARVISNDGATVRGTLVSLYGTDTAFPLQASKASRIVNAQAVTNVTSQPGDRIVVEVGAHAAAPTAAGSYDHQVGTNAASDLPLTSANTSNVNPWCEFSQNLWASDFNNYQFAKAGDGMSVSERIR